MTDADAQTDGQRVPRGLYSDSKETLNVTFLQILSYVAVGIVAIVLFAGLWNLARRGSPNTSQKLMRARVLFQLIAIIVVMTLLYFIQRNSAPGTQ